MENNELKPCPCCGGEAKKKFIGNEHTKYRKIEIKCTRCRLKRVDAAMRFNFEWLDNIASEQWNRRAALDELTQLGQEMGDFNHGVEEINPHAAYKIAERIARGQVELMWPDNPEFMAKREQWIIKRIDEEYKKIMGIQ